MKFGNSDYIMKKKCISTFYILKSPPGVVLCVQEDKPSLFNDSNKCMKSLTSCYFHTH